MTLGLFFANSTTFAQDLTPADALIINNLMRNFGVGTFQGINVYTGTLECSNRSEDVQQLIESCAIQPVIRFSRSDLPTAPVYLQPGSPYGKLLTFALKLELSADSDSEVS